MNSIKKFRRQKHNQNLKDIFSFREFLKTCVLIHRTIIQVTSFLLHTHVPHTFRCFCLNTWSAIITAIQTLERCLCGGFITARLSVFWFIILLFYMRYNANNGRFTFYIDTQPSYYIPRCRFCNPTKKQFLWNINYIVNFLKEELKHHNTKKCISFSILCVYPVIFRTNVIFRLGWGKEFLLIGRYLT